MYTTTQRRLLPGPGTTFSVNTGAAACAVAQLGSFAMSIGFIFGAVPVYVTLPLIAPALAGGAPRATIADPTRTTPPSIHRYCARIGNPSFKRVVRNDYRPPPAGPMGFSSRA